jgi:protein-S-isoprenylcysteine O-methyltransferase Ste14
MTMRDQLRRQGEVLFRYRGWTFLAALALFLLALRESDWIEGTFGDAVDDVYDFTCLGIGLAGLAVRIFVAGHVPGRTSGRNTRKGQVAGTLNSTGPYSVVRHPLYVGNFLIALGVALLPGSLWFALVACLGYCVVFERIMYAEEEFLRSKFGAEFEEWAERTPAFLPDFSRYRPSALPFSRRTALKREYLTVLEILAWFAVVDYAEDGIAGGLAHVEWEPETTIPVLAVGAACLVVRYLRKQTKVLHVAGR